jgi:hypothetical protein
MVRFSKVSLRQFVDKEEANDSLHIEHLVNTISKVVADFDVILPLSGLASGRLVVL